MPPVAAKNTPAPKPKQVCDLCGNPHYQVFSQRGRDGKKLTTVICQECGLVYTNPRISDRENAEFYHHKYWGVYNNQDKPNERFFRHRLPKIKSLLTLVRPFLKPGVKVLEVGCSVGALLWAMKKLVGTTGQFIGIEAHLGHARFAREKKELDVREGLLDEQAYKLPNSHFDLVLMNHVLEHTTSPTVACETARRILRPGGILIAEVPNVEAPGSRLSHFFHLAHHYSFSPRTLKRLGQKTGFKVRRVDALDGDLPGTRLLAMFEKPVKEEPLAATRFIRDDPTERANALNEYERWYWLTAASLRKKVTHWQRRKG